VSSLTASFAAQLDELESSIRHDWRWPSPEAAFSVWLAHRVGVTWPVDPLGIANERWREAPILATVGFLVGAGRLGGPETELLLAAVQDLTEKEALPADRNSFMFRPTELLGITVGVVQLADDAQATRRWLIDALRRGQPLFSTDSWSATLTNWAARLVGADVQIESAAPDRVETMALRVLWRLPEFENVDEFLAAVALRGVPGDDIDRSAATWAALHAAVAAAAGQISVVASKADAITVVERLCRRFPAFIVQLARRHDGRDTLVVRDEYDVQDALHAVLRLHFSDVRDEEPGPSHAATTTRLDLLLKGERIVVETKMTRPSMTQRKLLEEIAIDKERYRSHPDCGAVVFFIYDPGGHLKNPVALERDASETIGTVLCRVIVAPREHGADNLT